MSSEAKVGCTSNLGARDPVIESLLYISRSTVSSDQSQRVISSVVDTARRRNSRVGLTGALLFTGTHFAQVIEGDANAIERLMVALRRDARHDDLRVVERQIIPNRRFTEWSMAYFGPSQFVSRHVTRLLGNPSTVDRRRAAEWLTDLLCEFAAS
ncbi:BLUF domain-containing protein [Sphingomonas japonica]|uniref:BLUF domain-containing protein n=1 Tax=Sphingomonas japonica TaxID=511662 RepID=A0ABX0U705_9SPHN|nr:BLUF domain-containing protein [Sphingomonas japonica]NIJ25211.1 hypothetical protein [Sphingomonas japonica]